MPSAGPALVHKLWGCFSGLFFWVGFVLVLGFFCLPVFKSACSSTVMCRAWTIAVCASLHCLFLGAGGSRYCGTATGTSAATEHCWSSAWAGYQQARSGVSSPPKAALSSIACLFRDRKLPRALSQAVHSPWRSLPRTGPCLCCCVCRSRGDTLPWVEHCPDVGTQYGLLHLGWACSA